MITDRFRMLNSEDVYKFCEDRLNIDPYIRETCMVKVRFRFRCCCMFDCFEMQPALRTEISPEDT